MHMFMYVDDCVVSICRRTCVCVCVQVHVHVWILQTNDFDSREHSRIENKNVSNLKSLISQCPYTYTGAVCFKHSTKKGN